MSRTKGIIAAAAFTGLVLLTILALGFGDLQPLSAGESAGAPATEAGLPPTSGAPSEETLQGWQEYSTQLEETVRILQERDTAYQQQLEAANATILQLQDQVNSSTAPRFAEEHEEDEYEEREYEEHEYEEHEYEEHEGFEFGEFDD